MRSVERLFAIFDCFTPEEQAIPLQVIAERTELPKATAFRMVRSLEKVGYLVRLEDRRYCLSFRFVRLAGMVYSLRNIRQFARPAMSELAKQTQETVTLNTVDGGHRVVIDVIETRSELRSVPVAGEHIPLVNGATAKMLMAHISGPAQQKVMKYAARHWKKTLGEVEAEMLRTRRQGYAVSHGERTLGVTSISAPIRDFNNEARYCITVGGASVRIKPRENELVQKVITCAKEISRCLGGD